MDTFGRRWRVPDTSDSHVFDPIKSDLSWPLIESIVVVFKLNISNPATGAQKLIDIEDDKKLRPFMDKRISQEVDASCLGNEWKVDNGLIFKTYIQYYRPFTNTYTLSTSFRSGSASVRGGPGCRMRRKRCMSQCMLD